MWKEAIAPRLLSDECAARSTSRGRRGLRHRQLVRLNALLLHAVVAHLTALELKPAALVAPQALKMQSLTANATSQPFC